MKTRINITSLIILFTITCAHSQITIRNTSKNDTIVQKPDIYDSLKQFEGQERKIDYKQYIGLQFYLSPFSNPLIDQPQNTKSVSCLYSIKPSIIEIDTNYDGLRSFRTISSRFNKNNLHHIEYNKIFTYKYKPFHYSTGGVRVYISNSKDVGDRYFTLLDVLYGDTLFSFWEQRSSKIWEIDSLVKRNVNQFKIFLYQNLTQEQKDQNWYNWYNSNERILTDYVGYRKNERIPDLAFVLKDDKNGDTLYCTNPWQLIFVPYFVKQKQNYEGKNLICNGYFKTTDLLNGNAVNVVNQSKWYCEDVTYLKKDELNSKYIERFGKQSIHPYGRPINSEYILTYILKNNSGTSIAITGLGEEKDNYMLGHYFLEESIFNKKEKEKKLRNDEIAAIRKQEEKTRIKEENEAAEKYRRECVNKFVQYYGELIAQGKVTLGMTQEMCKMAWGQPYLTNKTTTEYGVYENWYYGYGYSLHFIDGVLKIIKE